MNIFQEAKQILDKDGKVNALGPFGKGKMTGLEVSTYFRRNKVKDKQIKKAVEVALDMSGAMTVAYKEISKFYGKKVADSKEVTTALQYANEETIGDLGKASALDGGDQSADKGLTEGEISDVEKLMKKGQNAKQIAKKIGRDSPREIKALEGMMKLMKMLQTDEFKPYQQDALEESKPKGHPPGPMMKMYGPFDRSKLKKKMTSSHKKQFDALYKKMDGGKEHMAIKKKIKNQVKADDAFHSLVMKKVMGEEIQVISFFDTFRNMQTEGKEGQFDGKYSTGSKTKAALFYRVPYNRLHGEVDISAAEALAKKFKLKYKGENYKMMAEMTIEVEGSPKNLIKFHSALTKPKVIKSVDGKRYLKVKLQHIYDYNITESVDITEGKLGDSIIRKDFPNVWAASAKDRTILKKFHTKVDTSNYKKQKQIYNKNKKAFMSGLGKEKLSSIMKKMTVKKGPMKGWMTDEVIRILHQGQQYVQETSLEEFNLNMPEKVRVQLLTLYNKAMDVPYGSPAFKGIKKQIDKINNKYAAKNEVAEKKVNWLLQKKAGEKGTGVAAYDKGKMVGYYPDMKTAKKFAPGLKYVQESEVTRAKEIADLKDKHKREIEKEKEDVKAIQKDEQLVGKEAIPFFDTYRNMHKNEAHKKYGVSSGEWQKHMGTERGVKKRVERKVRASGKKQIRKQLRREETKQVIPFFDTFRNMQEEVMDITVDPKNKLPKTDQQNKIAQKIYNLAKTYNCKVAMVGKHLRFKGTKGDMNAIGRAVIGKSSMGNATGSDMSTPQIDKMLNKNLK